MNNTDAICSATIKQATHRAPIRHRCSVALVQDAGDGCIGFLISHTKLDDVGKYFMNNARNMLLAFALAVSIGGCATLDEIRDQHSSIVLGTAPVLHSLEDCHSGRESSESVAGARNSIEDYGKYLIGYAEFDDQGWNTGTTSDDSQVKVLLQALDKEVNQQPLLILVFVHGWHHNAYTNDCNVKQFRAMVQLTSENLASAGSSQKVMGVYVGWRGESVNVPVARYTTIYSRKLAAEHVAKGSVRELFARLKLFETKHRKSRADETVRTIIIGHSFGGLIAFHSLSQSLMEDIVFGATTCEENIAHGKQMASVKTESIADNSKWNYPDLVVLINPAFEASRYEALYQASELPGNCKWDDRKRPRMISIAADNDLATSTFFPAARWMATILEHYNDLHRENERNANLNVIGFVDRYRTHRLQQCLVNGKTEIVLQEDFGGAARDRNTPLLVARAAPNVIYGHDGFLYSPATGELNTVLMSFLADIYKRGQDAVSKNCDN